MVDDNNDVRGLIARLLEQAGASVLALASGVGIEVTIADFHPDLLILDIGMPGEDGYALIRRIRRLSIADGGELPAISLTAHARDEDRRRAIDAGFQAHLSKPVNVPDLLNTVWRLLRERRTSEAFRVMHEARPPVDVTSLTARDGSRR